MDDCRRKVEEAMRRHRSLAGKPFPQGECGQPTCVHALAMAISPTYEARLIIREPEAPSLAEQWVCVNAMCSKHFGGPKDWDCQGKPYPR